MSICKHKQYGGRLMQYPSLNPRQSLKTRVFITIIVLIAVLTPVTSECVYLGTSIDSSLLPLHYKISTSMFDKTNGYLTKVPDGILWEVHRAFESIATVKGSALSFVYDGTFSGDLTPANTNSSGTIYVYLNGEKSAINASGDGGQTRNAAGKAIGGKIVLYSKSFDILNIPGATYKIILHELEHVLGAKHSPVAGAHMSYKPEEREPFLSLDDEDAMRYLYPAPSSNKGRINVTTTLAGHPAEMVQVALIDTKTGVARFQISDAKGIASFVQVPDSDYLVAGREVVPTGPCDFEERPKHFLTTFAGLNGGTNNPDIARTISVSNDLTSVTLPLIIGTKRYDCYFGMSAVGHFLISRGNSAVVRFFKDGSVPYHTTETSGGVTSGTELIPAGSDPGYSIQTIRDNVFTPLATPEAIDYLFGEIEVEPDASPGPRAVYCNNNGEYSLMAVGFHLVETSKMDSLQELQQPITVSSIKGLNAPQRAIKTQNPSVIMQQMISSR